MKAMFGFFLTAALATAVGGVASAAPSTGATRAVASGQVVIVQAAPGMTVDLSIDDRPVGSAVRAGAVRGPFRLSPGTHRVTFAQGSAAPIRSTLTVKAGSNSDVVLHFPAARGQQPVVSSYRTPSSAIGPGKARLLVAHTATVPPADVKFDGKTVFRDIANGEFAEADVPQGTHRVALLPTGLRAKPILGPLEVTLAQRTATMVYAVGNPKQGSMDVITHVVRLGSDGAVEPSTIRTGDAGLAAAVHSTPFSTLGTVATTSPATRPLPLEALRCVLRYGAGPVPR